MKKLVFAITLLLFQYISYCWGFFGHKKINNYAVFLLPPQMMVLYKANIDFIATHAVDPDMRRSVVAQEAPRHYIDIDYYGKYPYSELPRKWSDAIAKFSDDTLHAHGIVPWHVQVMLKRLTGAFKAKDFTAILKNSADIGHYIADAHVPLHTNSNHNGQLTNQKGIHGFWESRVPELLAEKEFDFFIGKALYIKDPGEYIWARVLESAKEADSVLLLERELTRQFGPDKKYAFETRNNILSRQYSSAFTIAFNKKMDGMVERRMRLAIFSVASFWYTAWVNAGQPDLKELASQRFSEADLKEFEKLNETWKNGNIKVREHEESPNP